MYKKIILHLVLFITITLSTKAFEVKFDFLPGITYAVPMPLNIYQDDYNKISLTARYDTRDFESPIYYSYRLGVGKNGKFFEIEMNHLKLYLRNKPKEVEYFSISHGYNQVFFNRFVRKKYYAIRYGAGVVVTHPENKIRGLEWEPSGAGYYLSGICFQASLQKRLKLTKWFALAAEAKISFAYSKVHIHNGHANVPALAFHLLIGPEFTAHFKKR
ncbi:MAG: hypothetical protein N4A72_18175 [Bacteroidales bacterium]|jgi:hypothetical protein|nr:hypothetical protein [Bacteroidales bacterium]